MLFSPEMKRQILLGNKTETRRPVKDGERLLEISVPFSGNYRIASAKGVTKWQTQRDYAVPMQYLWPTAWIDDEREISKESYLMLKSNYEKSAHKAQGHDFHAFMESLGLMPFRIKVLGLDSEPVHAISEQAAGDGYEGFGDGIFGFWNTYIGFYKKSALKRLNQIHDVALGRDYVKSLGLPDAWVIKFDPPQNFMLEAVR